jgi:hypothetical protein
VAGSTPHIDAADRERWKFGWNGRGARTTIEHVTGLDVYDRHWRRRGRLLALYRSMVLIRSFERQIDWRPNPALAPEAVTVGAAAALDPEDYVVTPDWDHRFALARGIDDRAAIAELFGRGRTGGGWRIVAGRPRAATMLAQSLVNTGRPRAVLCVLGERAASSVDLQQCLDLAASRRLPVVVLVHGDGMPGAHRVRVDGADVEAVHDAAAQLLECARREREPALLEATTNGVDPLSVAAGQLVELGMQPEKLLEISETVDEIVGAVSGLRRREGPHPAPAATGLLRRSQPRSLARPARAPVGR